LTSYAGVNCASVLEKATPPWLLDREIVIVTHGGAGWWDPNSDATGDVFRLVQYLEPGLNFGEVRKMLRPQAEVRPDFAPAERARDKRSPPIPVAQRWARRPQLRRCSAAWRYLESRGLPRPRPRNATLSEKAPAARPGSPTAIPRASSSTSTFAARPTGLSDRRLQVHSGTSTGTSGSYV
jgi:hypothetical protein